MPGTPWRARLAALGATTAILVTACGGAATPTPAPATAPPTAAPTAAPATEAPYTALTYPSTGEVDCAAQTFNGQAYVGELKQIKALDAKTVEFTLCTPDVAFLSKVAFASVPVFDADWLAKAVADGSFLDKPNGTGPYKLKEWTKGERMVLEANPDYWGDKAQVPNLVFRWSGEAAQRLVELKSAAVDGIDNPGTDDIATIQADSSLRFDPRAALNVFYLGMNNTVKPWDNEKVRQAIAMGIDRKRIVDTFYPKGSEVATHFTPCVIPFACGGADWYGFDAAAAKKLLADAGYPDGFKTKIQYRDVVRGYLPDPAVVAQDLQAQLKANLNIDATIEVQESGTFLDNNAAGTLDGLFMLGWTGDWPDATNFMDYHFGAGAGKKFGTPYTDIVSALNTGGQTADTAAREAAYTQANELVKQHVPMVPIAHSASGTAWLADVEGAVSSPLGDEFFFPVKPGTRDTVVWMQNAEPLSLYCPDETDGETIRACIQIYQGLYTVKVGGTDPLPALATECKPNAELSVWTCTLRDGVKFEDGAALDANDVVTSFSAQWDAANPLHKGRTSVFEYWATLFGGYLNPPPPAQ